MRLQTFCLLLGSICSAAVPETDPPAGRFRTVHREAQAGPAFRLVSEGRVEFGIWPVDASDPVLAAAAADFSRYFEERWLTGPAVLERPEEAKGNLIVLASAASLARLPEKLRSALPKAEISGQGFLIEQVEIAPGRRALVCLGGSPIGARYAAVEILHRMSYGPLEASFGFRSLRDEPYSTWRAIYINDSSHQANGYSPNLIYPVETFRWPLEKWYRYIDQMAYFRFNVLQIWIVPNLFSPDLFAGGGAFDMFRDTMQAVGRYARLRGIQLCLGNGVNVAVKAGTRLDTWSTSPGLPMYTVLSPLRPGEKALSMRMWDYWTRAIPEVGIWSLFPGDPGGCVEQGCGPETYVDLAIEIAKLVKRNNPRAIIDFTPWQFYGWGPTWLTKKREDAERVDRGYCYLLAHVKDFPADTIFGPNLNDFTSEPPVRGAGYGGGSAVRYLDELAKHNLVHTWSYFATEGEGWLNHHYKVPGIIRQRQVDAHFPVSGGICYTMTPAFNILNQYACAETFWNPDLTEQQIMRSYTEGAFGNPSAELIRIFPDFDLAPMVGYTFAEAPAWKPDYAHILETMRKDRAMLTALGLPHRTRFEMLPAPAEYANELVYFCDLYIRNSQFGMKVARARELIRKDPRFAAREPGTLRIREAIQALDGIAKEDTEELRRVIAEIRRMDVARWKREYRAKHYQIFLDYPTEFSLLLPNLVEGFFQPFGGDFLAEFKL